MSFISKVMHEELQLMHQSSYYLNIQRRDLVRNAEQQTLHLSDSMVWLLLDQQRLQGAMSMAQTHVRLLLAVLRLIYEENVGPHQELLGFVVNYQRGLVDRNTAASVQQKLQQSHQLLNDFVARLTCNLGPLQLQNRLMPNRGNIFIPQLRVMLTVQKPVVFNRLETCAAPSSVYLSWEVARVQSKQLEGAQFTIHVRNLHPTSNNQDQHYNFTCQLYHTQVNNLIPDRFYQFSVKRVDAVNLVYGPWSDTIILKTLDIST